MLRRVSVSKSLSPRHAHIVESVKTPWNTMTVVRTGQRMDLDVEGATYATWHPRHVMTGYSWDALSIACLLRHASTPKSVLILGLGGGTVARQLKVFVPDVRIVGVEIDAGVVDAARRHLHLDESVEVHVGDAYDFLQNGGEQFDAVIDDLFLTGDTDVVRSRVPDGDTLKLVRSRVKAGGVVVANLITDKGDHADVRKKARAGFRAAFPKAKVVTPPQGLNEILVGGDDVRPRPPLELRAHLVEAEDLVWFDSLKINALR